ncbi:hypothetical protein GOODEAATRI_027653, partial [Goodea atripinnis]
FCIYYISRGVLQENRQELVVFVLSVLVVMIRSVVNFSVVGSEGKQEVLVSHQTLSGTLSLSSNPWHSPVPEPYRLRNNTTISGAVASRCLH